MSVSGSVRNPEAVPHPFVHPIEKSWDSFPVGGLEVGGQG